MRVLSVRAGVFVAFALLLSACGDAKKEGREQPKGKEKGGNEAQQKIDKIWAQRWTVQEDWMKLMEENASDPVAGLQKGTEFVEKHKAEMASLGTDLKKMKNAGTPQEQQAAKLAEVDNSTKLMEKEGDVKKMRDKYGDKADDVFSQYKQLLQTFRSAL